MPSSLFTRQSPFDDARNTISSWDNCMAKSYCKWPVIVAIIVVSLILFSVVTCIARCICCGAECACCCFRCCSCCCGSGGRSSHRRIKSETAPPYHSASYPAHYGRQGGGIGSGSAPAALNNPYAQAHAVAPRPSFDTRPINQQYRSNPMPTYGHPTSHAPERPQFATFDSTRAVVNEDSLPAMPTWKDGRDVHVQVEEAVPEKKGDVELNRLDRNGSIASAGRSAAGGAVAGAGVGPGLGAARKSPGPARSPVSPMADSYGFPPPGYQNSQDGYASVNASANAVPPRRSPAPQHGPYAPQKQYSQAGDAYGHVSAGSARGDGYGQQHLQANRQPYARHHPAGQQQVYEDAYDRQDDYNHHQHQYDQYASHNQQDHYNHPHSHTTDPIPHHYTPPPQHTYNNNNNTNTTSSSSIPRYPSPTPPPTHNLPPPPQHSTPSPHPTPYPLYELPSSPPKHNLPSPPAHTTIYELPSPAPTPAPAYPGQRRYGEPDGAESKGERYLPFRPGGG